MAGPSPWFEWLSGLVSGLWSRPPAPGSREAFLELQLAGALLSKELLKPPGQRDEEQVHTLLVDYRRRELEHLQIVADRLSRKAAACEQPLASHNECCAAAAWAWRRIAALYRAVSDFYRQEIEQVKEELAAAEARRPAVIVAEPALRLVLPTALQQRPPRLDMCSACARRIDEAEVYAYGYKEREDVLRNEHRRRGLLPAPTAGAASREAAGPASAAVDLPAGEAQLGQQQGQEQQEQGQQQCAGGSGGDLCGAEGAPATPKAPQPTPQQQHSSSDQEHEQHQE